MPKNRGEQESWLGDSASPKGCVLIESSRAVAVLLPSRTWKRGQPENAEFAPDGRPRAGPSSQLHPLSELAFGRRARDYSHKIPRVGLQLYVVRLVLAS